MCLRKYTRSTYGDGHWYSEDATEKGKRKAEEDEDEELQSAKRHRAIVDVTEPEAHLTHEEIAQFVSAQEDDLMDYIVDDNQSERSTGASSATYEAGRNSYYSLPDEATTPLSDDSTYSYQHFQPNYYPESYYPEVRVNSVEEEYGGWRFRWPTYKSSVLDDLPQSPQSPSYQASLFETGQHHNYYSSPDLRPWYMGDTRFSSAEQQEYLYRRFPATIDSLVSPVTPLSPLTPAQMHAFVTPALVAPVPSELDEWHYQDGWSSGSDTDSDLSTVRAASPEPMEPRELQSAPKCTFSSVIASALPSGSHTGKQRALIIALEYEGQRWNDSNRQSMRLRGPFADAEDIYKLLLEHSYQPEDIRVMTDYVKTPEYDQPTLGNLEYAFTELVDDAQAGDRFFLYFAGHGKQVLDRDGDEVDGYDEGIIPSDWSTSGYSDNGIVIDDFLRDTCVDRLPKGAQLTAVFDSCHSGTILDLPYEHSAKSGPFPEKAHDPDKVTRTVVQHHEREVVVIKTLPGEQPKQVRAEGLASIRTRIYGSVDGRVLCISACKDNQRAYARKRGLVTEAFTSGLRMLREAHIQLGFDRLSRVTLRHLYNFILERASLDEDGRVQDPMLSSSYPMIPAELNRRLVI